MSYVLFSVDDSLFVFRMRFSLMSIVSQVSFLFGWLICCLFQFVVVCRLSLCCLCFSMWCVFVCCGCLCASVCAVFIMVCMCFGFVLSVS